MCASLRSAHTPSLVGRCNTSPVHRYGPGPYTYWTGLTMHLPFPQDLHDFVWLEARDFRPALFTGQGQESSQFAASTLRRKFQRQHTSRQALRVSGRTLAKTRAQRKLALPRVAQPQRPLASEVFFRAAIAPTARCSAGRQRRLIFKFARHPAPGSASTQHRDVMTLTVCINAQGLVYLRACPQARCRRPCPRRRIFA